AGGAGRGGGLDPAVHAPWLAIGVAPGRHAELPDVGSDLPHSACALTSPHRSKGRDRRRGHLASVTPHGVDFSIDELEVLQADTGRLHCAGQHTTDAEWSLGPLPRNPMGGEFLAADPDPAGPEIGPLGAEPEVVLAG